MSCGSWSRRWASVQDLIESYSYLLVEVYVLVLCYR